MTPSPPPQVNRESERENGRERKGGREDVGNKFHPHDSLAAAASNVTAQVSFFNQEKVLGQPLFLVQKRGNLFQNKL